jgi:predicted chitinase
LAFETAAWYWRTWSINEVVKTGDFKAVTAKIIPANRHGEMRLKRLMRIRRCIAPNEFAKTPV